jgi:hypothetical protein
VAYAAAFNGPCYVTLLSDEPAVVPGFYITNSSYAYTSMMNGDASAKKFEQGDWFLLTISGALEGKAVNTTVEFYLAKGKNYVADWTYVDLSALGKVDELHFALTGTKANDFGMTTPAYFAFDDLGAKK